MRTREEILLEMDEEFAKHTSLSDLNNSNSAVSVWQNLKALWVTFVQMLESRWDNLKSEIETSISVARTGTKNWYVNQVLNFQLGDSLDVVNGAASYAVVDPSKRIIAQASATEDLSTGRIMIRSAKLVSASELGPLETWELAALKEYVGSIKYAGVPVDVVSLSADEVKIVAKVKIDPQKITTLGTFVSDPAKYPVSAAIAEYLRRLPADSVISWTALTDYLQGVPGVKDFVITETYMRRPGTTAWISTPENTVSPAGYAILHPDSNLTFQN